MYDAVNSTDYSFEVRDLTVDAGSRKLIDIPQVSLGNTGVTVVMGPNGAGKSLLLRLLHGLVAPSAGRILYFGELLSRDTRHSQSLVPQSPVLLRRTAEANVRFVLKVRGLLQADSKQLLKRVHLLDKADTPARRLSGGEKQRLAMAQALATDPSVLMLDEPTASLDPGSTLMIEEILRATVARGTRVLLVTHDAAQARRLADDIVFLEKGRVVEHQPAIAFFDAPQSMAARDYLAGRLRT